MNGRQFAMAALFALFLLTLAFIPAAQQQGGGAYDPWLDYNEDGTIDVNELNPLGQAYGTSGDPTKNVTIAGHVTRMLRLAYSVEVPAGNMWDSGLISIDGYSKVTLLVYVSNSPNEVDLWAWDNTGISGWLADKVQNVPSYMTKTYDVMNQQMKILIGNWSGTVAYISVGVYLVA